MSLRNCTLLGVACLILAPGALSAGGDTDGLFDLGDSFSSAVSELRADSLYATQVTDLAPLKLGEEKSLFSGRTGTEISVGAGIHFGGEITIENGFSADVDLEEDFFTKISLDTFPVPYFGAGIFFSYAQTEFKDLPVAHDIHLVEFGAAVKARIPLFDLIYITPGLGLGYRGILLDFPGEDLERVDGLAVNFGVDIRVRFANLEVWIEPGFITQPWGSHEEGDVDVTFDPIPYFIGGVALAF